MSGASAPSGPEVRLDQLTGMRVLVAPGRAARPDDFAARAERPEPRAADTCPFCPGREERTPPEVAADRPGGGDPDTPGWRTRVVPNLYPALADGDASMDDPTDPLAGSSRTAPQTELFSSRLARGGHEVIVSGPDHRTSLGDLDSGQLSAAVAMWRSRIAAHADASCCHLIVNEGPEAGASLEHTHAQLYALPFVPTAIARERERFAAYHAQTQGSSLLTDLLAEEVRRRERVVAIDDEAVLLCPYASRSPFELRLVPRRASPRFEEDDSGSAMLGRAFELLGERLGGVPQLNLWVRTAPRGVREFHWHIDIVPRISIRAGFELGTGVDINVYPPERAAKDLRGDGG